MAQKAGGDINISEALGALTRRQIITFGVALVATALAAILTFASAGAVLTFAVAGVALAMLAAPHRFRRASNGLTLVGLYCILAVSFWWG